MTRSISAIDDGVAVEDGVPAQGSRGDDVGLDVVEEEDLPASMPSRRVTISYAAGSGLASPTSWL